MTIGMWARGDNLKKIYVCSRLKGDIENNIEKAKGYARFVAKECGAIPIAPHIYFTQFLDDTVPEDRAFGMMAGLLLLSDCDEATADAFWCSGKYLNMMYFSEVCGSGQCGFEAICPDTTMADAGAEVLDMYITYRSAGRGGSCTGACSFDMDSVLEAYPHVRTFRVMMKDMDVQYVDIVRPEENGAARDIMPVRM